MPPDQFEFGVYRLDSKSAILFRKGRYVPLPPKVAELLLALVQAEDGVLSRGELLQRLWPNTIVEEGSLTSHISLLRKALGEDPKTQDFIETIPKRGYRFAAVVERAVSGTRQRGGYTTLLLALPFENFTAGDRYDYFSDGLTEEKYPLVQKVVLAPHR
jgi:DNA-binding winged helix-turn-helix (wHTH) protein